jgi:Phage integrase family
MRVRRAAASSGEARRRWEKSRDADESYLDEQIWNRMWARAVIESGIPFKPTAYQVRHTHASWLIDAGENPKAVMHRLGQADLRTTARQSMCSTKPGSQPPGGSKGYCRRCDHRGAGGPQAVPPGSRSCPGRSVIDKGVEMRKVHQRRTRQRRGHVPLCCDHR